MATFYSDTGLIQNDVNTNNSGKRPSALAITGNLSCAYCKYTTDGTEVAGDFIRLIKLPPKVIIHPNLSTIHTSAVLDGGTGTMSIGDDNEWSHITADPDRYMAAVDCVTSAETIILGGGAATSITTAAVITPYVTTKEGWIDLKVVTIDGAALSASGVITVTLVYSVLS